MIRALVIFLKVLAAILVAVAILRFPGSFSVEWLGYRIDAHIGVGLLIVVALIGIGVVAVRVYKWIRNAPREFSEHRRLNRREKGFKALAQGFLSIAAGDVADATRQARKVSELAGENSLALLLTAQAAQLSGDSDQAQKAFQKMRERDDSAFLGIRGLLTIALRDGNESEALTLAEDAYRLRPQTPWVVQTLFDLQVRRAQWLEAQTTLRLAMRDRTVPELEAKRKKAVLLLIRADEAEVAGSLDEAQKLLKEAHALSPGLAPVAIKYAEILHRQGSPRRAIKSIEQTWAVEPSHELATAYMTLKKPADSQSKMRAVQRLQRLAPDHYESSLAVAEAAIEVERWKEARAALDAARERAIKDASEPGVDARFCALMARLEEGERGDLTEARAWLIRATEAKPAAVWHCVSCGVPADGWQPICSACGAFDSMILEAVQKPRGDAPDLLPSPANRPQAPETSPETSPKTPPKTLPKEVVS
ncbi:MAG: heme biosynthesis HemY N-terminal domain-containing protein, partial [Pseudomonadota bacterium]